jgi:hypothetical protein
MLLLWLGTLALAASPQLHSLLHQDSQSPTHHCFITQLQRHSVLAGSAPVTAPAAPPVQVQAIARAEPQFLASINYRLSPSRAPPSCFSSVAVAG